MPEKKSPVIERLINWLVKSSLVRSLDSFAEWSSHGYYLCSAG